ncbi:hypothetical protein LJB89_00610 [Tyzzerella sp. OttesenSCG-928-J15]|nr:hypothetical protein [Tyzzerella sp. OttesenSCG-928-J15]
MEDNENNPFRKYFNKDEAKPRTERKYYSTPSFYNHKDIVNSPASSKRLKYSFSSISEEDFKALYEMVKKYIKVNLFGQLFYHVFDFNSQATYLAPIASLSDLRSFINNYLNCLIDNDLSKQLLLKLCNETKSYDLYELQKENNRLLFFKDSVCRIENSYGNHNLTRNASSYKYLNGKEFEQNENTEKTLSALTENFTNPHDETYFYKLENLRKFLGYIISDRINIKIPFFIFCDDPSKFLRIVTALIPEQFTSNYDILAYKQAINNGKIYNSYVNIHQANPFDKALSEKNLYAIKNLMGYVKTSKNFFYVNTTKFVFLAEYNPDFYDAMAERHDVICLDFSNNALGKLLADLSSTVETYNAVPHNFYVFLSRGIKDLELKDFETSYATKNENLEMFRAINAPENIQDELYDIESFENLGLSAKEKTIKTLFSFIKKYTEIDASYNADNVTCIYTKELNASYNVYCSLNHLNASIEGTRKFNQWLLEIIETEIEYFNNSVSLSDNRRIPVKRQIDKEENSRFVYGLKFKDSISELKNIKQK